MFSNIRRAWYNHQDRKIAKKYEPKMKKEKTTASVDKKPIIILTVVFFIVVLAIVGAVLFNSSKSSKNKTDKKTTVVSSEITSVTEVISETSESATLPLYTEEPTEKKKKKKKHKSYDEPVNNDIYIDSGDDVDNDSAGGSNDFSNINNSNNVDLNNNNYTKAHKKTVKPKKPKVKRKANNIVPAQYEHNSVLGSSNVSLIKNSLRGSVGGSINSNMKNLAIYLANTGSSSANSALKSLCGYTTLKASCRRAVVKCSSNSKADISNATIKIVNKLSGSYGSYGVGVSARFSGGKYVIIVVVAYRK